MLYKFHESIKWYNKGKFIIQDDNEQVNQYDDFITNDKFRKFLLDNNCYDDYIKNCHDKFKLDFNNINPIYYISSSFSWYEPINGYNFWSYINDKWIKLNKMNESI